MSQALAISLTFPRGVYSGAVLGIAEDVPEHARVHEAFVAAAAGGPTANEEGNVLVATDEHRRAVEWLEETEPLGVIVPPTASTTHAARRYRWRASPVAPADTDFEPFSALAGPVVYLWPAAPDGVVESLREIALEVTHVGRADSIVIVGVGHREVADGPGVLRVAAGRGTGRVMRIPRAGRCEALVSAHAAANRPGRHGTGSLGRQASDEMITGANDEAVELRRFAPTGAASDWPFSEVWQLSIEGRTDVRQEIAQPANSIAAAVALHRALIRAIGEDVPPFVTGRDGDSPLRGAGHLAIHLRPAANGHGPVVLLAIPDGTSDADREQLALAVRTPLRAGARLGRRKTRWFTASSPTLRSAAPFWPDGSPILRTAVPLVVEVNGGPRRGNWTLDDAVVCSVGFALRGLLERQGIEWGSGWKFRSELVRRLREEHGVDARASRVRERSSRFVHRAREDDLIVAADALVDLGDLAPPDGAGFLALGRARHLGGGLLVPCEVGA
ncbi:MAG: type I-U CRISPR-associated protein Csb2 [Solirubrobacteraceae bacterium]|nr:type I-U CRISPR-associated protein Csb2 [Solirubrobacteraceae bacterium]